MTTDKTPTEALAQLRHLYAQLKSQDGMSRTDRARTADGILSPAIAALEKWGQPAQAAEPVCKGVNCLAVRGVGHSTECESEHDSAASTLNTAGNRNPEARYAGYKGQPALPAYTEDQLAAWQEGASARITTAAPQPVAREPLTPEQIAEMMRDTWGCASIAPRHALAFARAVERAHGIKGGQHGTK